MYFLFSMLTSYKKQYLKKQKGVAHEYLLFSLATITITAGATLAIYEAYTKFIIPNKKQLRINQLEKENQQLLNEKEKLRVSLERRNSLYRKKRNKEVKQLTSKIGQLEDRLWKTKIIAEASHSPKVFEFPANKHLANARYGNYSEEILLLENSIKRIEAAISNSGNSNTLSLTYWTKDKIKRVQSELPIFRDFLIRYKNDATERVESNKRKLDEKRRKSGENRIRGK